MRVALVITLLVLLAGCGASGPTTDPEEALGGMGVPQQFRGEEYPGPRSDLRVRVHLAGNGCFLGRLQGKDDARRLVVWPAGTEQGDAGDELRLPGGTVVRHGALLDARGTVLATQRLSGFASDGYWGYAVGFCTPNVSEVLVLDSASSS